MVSTQFAFISRFISTYILPVAVFFLFLTIYLFSVGIPFKSSDGYVMYETARAIAFDHTLELPQSDFPQVVEGKNGHFFSKYDPGLPLLAAPIAGYADGVAEKAIANRFLTAAIFVMIVPTTMMAIAVTALFLIAKQFYNIRHAVFICGVAGLGTTIFPYARLFFGETVITAVLTLSVMILIKSKMGIWATLVTSILIGIGIITRASTLIYLPSIIYLVWNQSTGFQRRRALFILAIGPLMAIVALLWHNMMRFGDPLTTGYEGETFSTFPLIGAMGMLISPGKSIFLYTPPMILSAILFPRFRRKHTFLANTLLMMTATCLLYYGAWWAWHGGWVWGPRFLVPLMPMWCLSWGELPNALSWKLLAGVIFIIGFGVQIVGTFTNVTPIYATAFEGTDDYDDETRYAMVHYDLSFSPLMAGIKRASKNQWEKQVIYELEATDLTKNWVYGIPQNIHRLFAISLVIIGWAIWRNPKREVEELALHGK